MNIIEVVPLFEFADGRAVLMEYSDFRAVPGLKANTLTIELFKVDEA
jgi:hypothetical protein